MKNCTPLWREAHVQVKMYKTPQPRSNVRSCDVEKVHAVVARSTCPSQNTPGPDHSWKLRCRKSARRCGAKHISKSKCTKHTMFRPFLEIAMSKKYTPLWREAHFEVKSAKNCGVRSAFGRSDVLTRGRRKGLCTVLKVSKTGRFSSISKNIKKRILGEDLQRCIFRGRRKIQETCSSEMLGGQGADFLRGVAFWSIRSSGLASLFRGRRSSLDRWSEKIAKRISTRPSALHSTFHF